jgi:hypothetical protein
MDGTGITSFTIAISMSTTSSRLLDDERVLVERPRLVEALPRNVRRKLDFLRANEVVFSK